MNRRFRILVIAIIMGFLVFSIFFQMVFRTNQLQRKHGINLPMESGSP